MDNAENYAGFVYVWTCKNSGRKYLGSHKGKTEDNYLGSGIAFKHAIKKYGIDAFTREIIEYVDDPEKIQIREQHWLDFYNVSKNPEFYNISGSASGGRTLEGKTEKELEEWRKKCSLSQRSKLWRPNAEQRKKMREASKLRWSNMTDEQKMRRTERLRGNRHQKSAHTEESKAKMRESQRIRFLQPGAKDKVGPKNPIRGAKHMWSVPVQYEGIKYCSKVDACQKLGLSLFQLNVLLSGEKLRKRGETSRKPVCLNGITYSSHAEAGKILGLSPHEIRKIKTNYKTKERIPSNAVPVVIDGVQYKSKNDAMRKLGLAWKSLSRKLTGEFIPPTGYHARKKVILDGVEYASVKEASRLLGLSKRKMAEKLKETNQYEYRPHRK